MPEVKEKTAKKVADHLYWDSRVDTSDIIIEVAEEKVKLTGTVPDYNMRGIAEDDALSVSGVKSVDNQLTVKSSLGVKAPTDELIKSNIENALSYNPNIDFSKISISVDNGEVELTGSVDAYWKKIVVEEQVAGISHVRELDNKLTVVPTNTVHDKSIAEKIVKTMERNKWIDVDSIDVKVEKGVVTLSGTVFNWAAYKGASGAAQYTEGVTDVINNLKYQ